MRRTKWLADLLTCTRILLAVYLAWLGIAIGKPALPSVVATVVVTWLTDLFDGPIARRDVVGRRTWVGDHDAEADLSVALGIICYLVFSGYVHPPIGLGLGLVLMALWIFVSHQAAWPAYAVPYAIIILLALDRAPFYAWVAIGYLLLTLAVTWPRFVHQYLREFFDAIYGLFPAQGNQVNNSEQNHL
jgi:phosphatidylglycerophosphate synthase